MLDHRTSASLARPGATQAPSSSPDVAALARVVARCCAGLHAVDPRRVARRARRALRDGAAPRELDELLIAAAAELSADEPQYDRLAARLGCAHLERQVRAQGLLAFSHSIAAAHRLGLIDDHLHAMVERHAGPLDHAIVPDRDHRLDHAGLRALHDHGLLRAPATGAVIETPQRLFLRLACALADDVPAALELYRLVSSLEYLPDRATLAGAGARGGDAAAAARRPGAINLARHTLVAADGRAEVDFARLAHTARTVARVRERAGERSGAPRADGPGAVGLPDVLGQLGLAADAPEARALSAQIDEVIRNGGEPPTRATAQVARHAARGRVALGAVVAWATAACTTAASEPADAAAQEPPDGPTAAPPDAAPPDAAPPDGAPPDGPPPDGPPPDGPPGVARLADVVVAAPGATGTGFGDPTRAVNGVRGAGTSSGSVDVYSLTHPPGTRDSITLGWSGDAVAGNGPGDDLAVFENPFASAQGVFMELVIVEVSRDGVAWRALAHDYTAADETTYVGDPAAWPGFAGRTPVLLHAETHPVDPFDRAAAGGDGLDLEAVVATSPDDAVAAELRTLGARYVRLVAAPSRVNPDTGAPYPHEPLAGGADLDGVWARYVTPPP